jgi:argininosuccinate lyase
LQPLVFSATADAIRAIGLFAGILGGCEVRSARMAERAAEDFLTVTELADTLVRREGMNFRKAHHLVSAAVKALNGHYSPEAMVEAVVSLAPSLTASRAELLEALDPRHFVDIRRIPGGPAPEALRAAIEEAQNHIAETQTWIEAKTKLMDTYPVLIQKESARL